MVKQIASIFFKVASVYLVLSSITHILSLVSGIVYLENVDEGFWFAGPLSGLLVLLIIAGFLWRRADTLPETLLGLDDQELNKNKIAALVLRMVGLYIFIQELPEIVSTIVDMTSVDRIWALNLFFSVGFAITGLLVWRFAEPLGRSLTRGMDDRDDGILQGRAAIDLQAIAFSILGLFILVQAVPFLLSTGITYVISTNLEFGADSFPIEVFQEINVAQVIMKSSEVIIGLWLLFGARGFSSLLHSFRDYGLNLDHERPA